MSAVFSKINEDEKAYDYARKALEIDETSLTLFNAASMANNIEKPEECLKILDNAIIEKNNDFSYSKKLSNNPAKYIFAKKLKNKNTAIIKFLCSIFLLK